jgi:endonuclease I
MFRLGFVLLAIGALAARHLAAAPPPGYYSSAQDKTGAALRLALHNIIKGHTVIPYSSSTTNDTVDALDVLDADPANTNNIICIYSRLSYPKTSFNISGGWNREHLWPDSYGIDGHVPYYSDLHNLRPEDRSVNSSRGNKYYDLSNTNDAGYRNPGFAEAPLTTTDSDSWEPPPAVRGDIARALFYMDVRYAGSEGTELDFILTDNTASIGSSTNLMGRLSTLIRWHWADPVDASEQLRNDKVDNLYQHNRNPFVDHPEWVDEVYGVSRPALSIARAGNQVRLSWSTNVSGGILEWTAGYPANWSALNATPSFVGSDFVVSLEQTNSVRLFRLRVP